MKEVFQVTDRKGKSFNIERDQVFNALLELAGGGYTTEQTMKAMQLKDELFTKNILKVNGYVFERMEVVE